VISRTAPASTIATLQPACASTRSRCPPSQTRPLFAGIRCAKESSRGTNARAATLATHKRTIGIAMCVSLMCVASTSDAQTTDARASVTDATLRRLPIRRVDASRGFRVSDDTLDFGRIAGGCLLGGGRAVFLSTVPRVLLVVHTRSAPAVRLVGKGGSGPGEFSQPWAVSCFSDDSVAVLELARITLVDVTRGASTSIATQPLQCSASEHSDLSDPFAKLHLSG
jgi:hypothetical protein